MIVSTASSWAKNEPEAAAVAVPLLEQLQRRRRHAGVAPPPPLLHTGADQVDELELDGGAARDCTRRAIVACARGRSRSSRPTARLLVWRLTLFEVPVMTRLLERRADDRLQEPRSRSRLPALMSRALARLNDVYRRAVARRDGTLRSSSQVSPHSRTSRKPAVLRRCRGSEYRRSRCSQRLVHHRVLGPDRPGRSG